MKIESIFIIIYSLINNDCLPAVTFGVVEESPTGLVIGNIDYLHSSVTNANYLINSSFFKVSDKGELMLSCRIDLETICAQFKLCCTVIKCVVETTIVAQDKSNYRRLEHINVHINILDKNDNYPKFSKPKQLIKVPENVPIGFHLPVEPAHDADVDPINSFITYRLLGSTNLLKLNQTQLPSIALIVQMPLDYEDISEYNATFEACDLAKQCNQQIIEIHVQDINDNSPEFVKQFYQKEIMEDFPVGDEILQVEAFDEDSDLYSKVLYGFHQDLSVTNTTNDHINATFEINEYTGSIKLRKRLSVKDREKYDFQVFAVDKVAPELFQKAVTDVSITVKDVNDNSPIITSYNNRNVSSNEAEINEIAPPTLLFVLHVTDDDVGPNAIVVCKLLRQYANDFQLNATIGNYSLSSARPFDYEIEREIKVEIECNDEGIPWNTVRKSFIVHVKDVNEFAPRFKKKFQELKLFENLRPGIFIGRVNATDRDGSAVLTYSITGYEHLYFTLDPQTGEIRSGRISLDRERVERVELNIIVTDTLDEYSKTGRCTVIVEILDENDNSPRFIDVPGVLTIPENSPIHSKVRGKIIALDDDKEEINNKVKFQLIRVLDGENKQISDFLFKVKENGEIFTLGKLDRETDHNYTLEIAACDTGFSTRCTTRNFTIYIEDRNDNSPRFIDVPGVLTIPENSPIHSKVTGRIIALDEDKEEINNKVRFQLRRVIDCENKRISSILFKVEKNGEIITLGRLDRETSHNYTLEIAACDTGFPTRCTTRNFTIYIEDENDNEPKWITPQFSARNIPTLNISEDLQLGEIIIKIKASDPDFGENSTVTYSMMSNNALPFVLDNITGEIRMFGLIPIGQYILLLRASDNGRPRKYNEKTFYISIYSDKPVKQNMRVFIICIGICGLMLVFFIITIICAQPRPKYNNNNSNNNNAYRMESENNFEPHKTNHDTIYLPPRNWFPLTNNTEAFIENTIL